jgi:hypothetical protein
MRSTVLFFAGGAVVYGKRALRQLRYGSGATHAIAEVEADHWLLVGMAVESDDHILRAFPSLLIEIRVPTRKALHTWVGDLDTAGRVQPPERIGIVDICSRRVAREMILHRKRAPVRRPNRRKRAADAQQHILPVRARVFDPQMRSVIDSALVRYAVEDTGATGSSEPGNRTVRQMQFRDRRRPVFLRGCEGRNNRYTGGRPPKKFARWQVVSL